MALKIFEKFDPRANPIDGNYPTGSIKNESVPGANDGTPLDAEWGNDEQGFTDALLNDADITHSGNADTVNTSDRLSALHKIIKSKSIGVKTLTEAVADTSARADDYVRISDLGNALWQYKTGQTPDGIKVRSADAVGVDLVLNPSVPVNPLEYGVVGDGVTNVTANILAISKDIPDGVGVNTVNLGSGTFIVDYIALRGISIIGNGWSTIIKASATPNARLVSARLNLDGTTANTQGNGSISNLTIDCNNENTVGLDLYGGFCKADNIQVINSTATEAVSIIYVLMTNISRIYSRNNTNDAFLVSIDSPLHDGDVSTSLDLSTLWSDSNGGWGLRLQNCNYSVVRSATTQNNALGGTFVEGGKYGLSVSTSMIFIGTASEADLNNAYYFKDVRNLTVINPFIIGAAGESWDSIVFDNCTGTIIDYSTEVVPAGGFYDIKIINAPTVGSIRSVGGDFTIDPAQLPLLASNGSIVNNTLMQSCVERSLIRVTEAEQINETVANIDGFTGKEIKANDGTRLAAFRRIGTPIFGTNGAINVPATNLKVGEVSFYATDSTVTFVVNTPTAGVKTGTIPLS